MEPAGRHIVDGGDGGELRLVYQFGAPITVGAAPAAAR
jgi:hypothetical protein